MILFLFFNSLMLLPLHNNLFTSLSFYHLSFYQLQTAHLIFVVINCGVAVFLKQKQAIEFLGQVNMLALITILLLLPIMAFSSLVMATESIIVIYLAFLTTLIIREYFRRMKYANIILKYKGVIAINLICLAAFLVYVFH